MTESIRWKPVGHHRLVEIAREDGARLDEGRDMAIELLAARTRIAMLELDVEKLLRKETP